MRIVFGADDENECTRAVVDYLRQAGDLQVLSSGSCEADFGVVMCWTGTGTSIAANKVPGIRAALAWEPWIARNARLWNDANVLALSLKRLAPDVAVECARAFLEVEAEDPSESASIDLIRKL
jgi:ribose 5-phosphate isomerase B